LWFDYVRRELNVSQAEVGHFSPAHKRGERYWVAVYPLGENDSWRYHNGSLWTEHIYENEENEGVWRVDLGSISGIYQIWSVWFGTAIEIPFERQLLGDFSEKSAGTDWPLLLEIFAAGGIYDGLTLTYPRWSTPALQSLKSGDHKLALRYIMSLKWRERRL